MACCSVRTFYANFPSTPVLCILYRHHNRNHYNHFIYSDNGNRWNATNGTHSVRLRYSIVVLYVHPTQGNHRGTLWNTLLMTTDPLHYYCYTNCWCIQALSHQSSLADVSVLLFGTCHEVAQSMEDERERFHQLQWLTPYTYSSFVDLVSSDHSQMHCIYRPTACTCYWVHAGQW